MMRNTRRYDLSSRLIHFFRAVDTLSENAPPIPESFGWSNINEEDVLPPLFMLRCAIRHCRIWATWSYRGGVRTIYGCRPAVCFTEMPVAAFLEAARMREKLGQAVSQYAVLFDKSALFRRGANPVIYGLDDRRARPSGKGSGPRILDAKVLPLREQYRYVSYHPLAPHPVDWSHEREWRWPFDGDVTEFQRQLAEDGVVGDTNDVPALDIAQGDDLAGMGVIVQSEAEAKCVAHDILALVDQHKAAASQFGFVLCADGIPLPSSIRDPDALDKAIEAATLDLAPYYEEDRVLDRRESQELEAMAQSVTDGYKPEGGEPGGCWLWLLDNTHSLTRALLRKDKIRVSLARRYLVDYFSGVGRGLQQREEMTKELADRVRRKWGIECGYFSVLGSSDPDAVPFYCSDHLENSMFYNHSSTGGLTLV